MQADRFIHHDSEYHSNTVEPRWCFSRNCRGGGVNCRENVTVRKAANRYSKARNSSECTVIRCLAACTVTGDGACILGACTRCRDSGLFQILICFTASPSLIATTLTKENWWLCTLASPKINVALGSAGATDTGPGSHKVLTNAHSFSAHVFSQYACAAPGLCNFGCLLQHTSWLHR